MRRFRPMFIAAVAALGALSLAGGAIARDHDGWGHGNGRGEHGGHGGEGRGAPPWRAGGGERGYPPGWGRGAMRQAPPPEMYGRPPGGYAPRAPYMRGGRLPPGAQAEVIPDPGRYRLRPPPRGYGWVRMGGNLMMMNMATGQIFDVVPE